MVVLLATLAVVPLTAAAAQTPSARIAMSKTALPQVDTTSDWIPSNAPMPASLPNGASPSSMTLYATSCSSSAFCVSVGRVGDASLDNFPLVETYSGGVWTASVAPTPANASLNWWTGVVFSSVSCPADGECAAVGLYDAYLPATQSAAQAPLLDNLSDGSWSTVEGSLPPASALSGINLDMGVSCPTPTSCNAVGTAPTPTSVALLWQWGPAGWSMQQLPTPPGNILSMVVNSISCADVQDCVAVGQYQDTNFAFYPLILTMTGGDWVASQAPLPPGAANLQGPGQLFSVDCPQVDYCVAGGNYTDTSQIFQPLLETLDAGVWTPARSPVPADAAGYMNTTIEGISCPAAGACIGTGFFVVGDGESGLVVTQSGSSWSAADAPVPARTFALLRTVSRHVVASTSSLQGVGCSAVGLCASSGTNGSGGLLEVGKLKGIPYLSSVSPTSGPGGTMVTLKGSGFTGSTSVRFGNKAAIKTSYVDATEVKAEVPSGLTCSVIVRFTENGLTDRSSPDDAFQGSVCKAPRALTKLTAFRAMRGKGLSGAAIGVTADRRSRAIW